MEAPRPAPDTSLHLLADGGLLFIEESRDLYVLNATAAFVWCCLEEGLEREEVVTTVEQDYGVAAAEAREQISGLLLQWEKLGLLAGTQRNRGTRTPPEAQEEASDAPEWSPETLPSFRSERSYQLLTTVFRLRYASAEQEATVHPVLAHLEKPSVAERVTAVDLVSNGNMYLLVLDGRCRQCCASLDELAPLIKWALLVEAINNYPYLLYVHAGVVRSVGGCLLLPAEPGSGKTSLTAALIHAGFVYMSDEVALLEEDTLHVRPVPVSLCIKDSAWNLLAPRYPELHDLAAHHRSDGKVVRYLNPPQNAMDPEPERSHPIRWIAFPRYAPGESTTLKPLRKAHALHRLLEQCLAMPAPLTQTKVANLVDWIRDIPCYELPMSSLDEAVALVTELCRE